MLLPLVLPTGAIVSDDFPRQDNILIITCLIHLLTYRYLTSPLISFRVRFLFFAS